MAVKATEQIAGAIKSFFDWLAHWNKTSSVRNDKRSIKIAKRLAKEVGKFKDINEVVLRAEFDEVYAIIKKCRKYSDDFWESLD